VARANIVPTTTICSLIQRICALRRSNVRFPRTTAVHRKRKCDFAYCTVHLRPLQKLLYLEYVQYVQYVHCKCFATAQCQQKGNVFTATMSIPSFNDDENTAHDDASSTVIKLTRRNHLLKLELTDSLSKNLEKVASTLYDLKIRPTRKANNSKSWKMTDGLMLEAKKSYDEIINAFHSEPRVYKFPSTKEKIWSINALNMSSSIDLDTDSITTAHSLLSAISKPQSTLSRPQSTVSQPPPLLSNRSQQQQSLSIHSNSNSKQTSEASKLLIVDADTTSHAQSVEEKISILSEGGRVPPSIIVPSISMKELTIEEQLETYLDPFTLVEPGSRVEVWKDKLDLLDKITPREDLDGYEYREDFYEQRYRVSIQEQFQRRMKDEIWRREQYPTDIEQVEDVLYDIVEAIASRQDR